MQRAVALLNEMRAVALLNVICPTALGEPPARRNMFQEAENRPQLARVRSRHPSAGSRRAQRPSKMTRDACR
eukprot:3798727-Pyramimonas_sp.AAC.1